LLEAVPVPLSAVDGPAVATAVTRRLNAPAAN
jgi:hypothetical protein